MLLIAVSYRKNLGAKLYTVINSLSAIHACLNTFYIACRLSMHSRVAVTDSISVARFVPFTDFFVTWTNKDDDDDDVRLSPSSIICYLPRGGDALRLGRWRWWERFGLPSTTRSSVHRWLCVRTSERRILPRLIDAL